MPILQRKKPRLGKVKEVAQGHTVIKRQSQDMKQSDRPHRSNDLLQTTSSQYLGVVWASLSLLSLKTRNGKGWVRCLSLFH